MRSFFSMRAASILSLVAATSLTACWRGVSSSDTKSQSGGVDSEVRALLATGQNVEGLRERIVHFSRELLGKPYLVGPLGEGEGAYDEDPLYRLDGFDCTTYVETVWSLAFASDLESFQQSMNRIRYLDGEVAFVGRNHFISLDWMPNNEASGLLNNITRQVGGTATASAQINKRAWYSELHGPQLANFLEQGRHLEVTTAEIPYVSWDDAFPMLPETGARQPNGALFARIPDGAMVNIIRQNGWPGGITELNVSHQGIAIWKDGVLQFRNAVSLVSDYRVMDMPFIPLFQTYIGHDTIVGFDVVEPRS